jgi:predicted dehydrogenase
MKKARMGLIGLGKRGMDVLPTIVQAQKWGFLELVSVCDVIEGVARSVGEKHHVSYYNSVEKMLEKEKGIDFVYICSGDYQHHIIGKMAAEHGKHVLVEKPMAVTLPCCDVLINACQRAGVYYEVGEQYFRGPTDRVVVEIIKRGVIGDVLKAYAIDPVPPASAIASRSGICMDMGVHRMSELRTYIRSEPAQVIGVTKNFAQQKQLPGLFGEDWGYAIVEFSGGKVGLCECAAAIYEDPNKNSFRKVVGTEGEIYIGARTNIIEGTVSLRKKEDGKFKDIPVRKYYRIEPLLLKKFLKSIIVKSDPEIVWKNPYAQYDLIETRVGLMDVLMSITNAVLYDKPPEYSINARKDVEMCVAWYESSLKQKPIRMPITSLTTYEKMIHDTYKKMFGHDLTDI